MIKLPRPFVDFVLLLTIVAAASLTIRAQELRDRQLIQPTGVGTVQTPVEIVSITLNGKEVRPGEKITGDDNWLRGISFTLKNISDRPVAGVIVGLEFPMPSGFFMYALPYGVDMSHGDFRKESSPPPLQPGQTVDVVLTNYRYKSFLHVLEQARASINGAPINLDTTTYYVETVCFENQPDVIWQRGFLKKRHPTEPGRYDRMERYVLPNKQN